jgi:hypothetical protein
MIAKEANIHGAVREGIYTYTWGSKGLEQFRLADELIE